MGPPNGQDFITNDGVNEEDESSSRASDPGVSGDSIDVEEDKLGQKQRETQITWNLWFIYLALVLVWLLGSFNFSIIWVTFFIGIIHFFWRDMFYKAIEETVAFTKRQVHRRRALQRDETAEWFNFILNRWWVFSSTSIFSWLKANFEPLLNETKPSIVDSLVLKACTFGDKTPYISSIRAFDANEEAIRPNASSFSLLKTPDELTSNAKMNLIQSLKYRLVIQADVGIICPEFKLTIAGKWKTGGQMNFTFEKLQLFGHIQIVIYFSMDTAFPHLTKATVTFLERPKISLSRTSLNNTRLPEVLGVCNWVNSIVDGMLCDMMVDPSKLDIDLTFGKNIMPAARSPKTSLAQGVLEVEIGWANKAKKTVALNNEWRRCVLRIGDQEYSSSFACVASNWGDRFHFLVDGMSGKLYIKVKTKKNMFFRGITTKFLVDLEKCLHAENVSYESNLSKNGIDLSLKMRYSQLQSIDVKFEEDTTDTSCKLFEGNAQEVAAGVMYIRIHGADGLPSDARSFPNPYCVVISGSRKLKTTHFVAQSTNPSWESSVEFIIFDFPKTIISIAVFNWDIATMSEGGLLGTAAIPLQSGQWKLLKHVIPLELYTSENDDSSHGSITVTAIFRPVPSLNSARPGNATSRIDSNLPQNEKNRCHQQVTQMKSLNGPLMTTAKLILPELGNPMSSISSTLAAGHGVMEVLISRARCLIAKDLNGLSDPFFEMKINQDCCYKGAVKKRTLNPEWMEKVNMPLPKPEDVFIVVVWDQDRFGKDDFLGFVSFTVEKIQQLALKNESNWFTLQDTKSGEIEMKFKIITEGLEVAKRSLRTF